MTRLSVNLNKIALLRNQRDIGYPCPVKAGRDILQAGANGLTVHPRPDERHIRRHDVYDIHHMMGDEGWLDKDIEYNIEGYPSKDFVAMLLDIMPNQVTFVPDAPDAKTSDHGWDLQTENTPFYKDLMNALDQLSDTSIRISLFMNALPDEQAMQAQIDKALFLGAKAVELYTEPYAVAFMQKNDLDETLQTYDMATKIADQAGLRVNAGHDLNLDNLPLFIKTVQPIAETSIGHAFIADALWLGLNETVMRYQNILEG